MSKEDLNNCLKKLVESIDVEVDDQVLKYANQYLVSENDQDVIMCKLIAMVKLEKHSQVLQFLKGVKEHNEEVSFLKAYTHYKLKEFADCERTIVKADQNDLKTKILRTQLLNKKEEFGASTDQLCDLIAMEGDDIDYIFEDLASNYFNSLAMLIWTNYTKGARIQLSEKRSKALMRTVTFCLGRASEVNLREVFLNLCILLAIDLNCGGGLFPEEEHYEKRTQALGLFYAKLEAAEAAEADKMDEELEEGEISDIEKDKLIAVVLEAIFQVKEKKVRIHEDNLQSVSDCYAKLGSEDIILKASFLSYILYMKIGNNSNPDLNEYSKQIDHLIKELKGSNLGSVLNSTVEKSLEFNRAITLFMRGRYGDINNWNISNDLVENNTMKHYVLMKRKDISSLERLYNEISGDLKDKIIAILIQISVYHMANNQNKYVELFSILMHVNMIL